MYRVTINIEPRNPQTSRQTPHFVARDENHVWRSWGVADNAQASSGRQLAEYLYHACEVGKVEVIDGVTVVEILETDAGAERYAQQQK